MPSTTSSVVSSPLASSTVMTPSLPTFSIASAMMSPMVESLLAEIVPTWAISLRSLVGLDRFFSSAVIASTARLIPRLSDIGSCPAATILMPSVKICRASTVAVVVPSPATSEVFDATSLTIWAPIFSNLSSSSISLATVTPSLVTVGAPKLFSNTTFRPLGPSVTVTASARILTPLRIFSRDSCPKRSIFAGMILLPLLYLRFHRIGWDSLASGPKCLLDDSQDVILAQDQQVFALVLELAARVFAEQDLVPRLDLDGNELAVVAIFTLADGDNLALLGLFLGGVRDDYSTLGPLLFLDTLDENSIAQWLDFHWGPAASLACEKCCLAGRFQPSES